MIAVAGGGKITLEADVVEKVQAVPPELAEYEKLRLENAETRSLDQMNLADWCRQHGLTAQRKAVLEHVLQLDPEQPEARKLLGYHKVKDQWMTHEEEQIDKGYVKSRNPSTGMMEWVPPQVAENRDSVQRRIKSEAEWRKKIHGYRRLDGRPGVPTRERRGSMPSMIRRPSSPWASGSTANGRLKKDPRDDARQIYVEVLGRFDTHDARGPLAVCAIDDPVEDVRLCCLDILEKQKDEAVTKYFEAGMRDKHASDDTIDRAGVGLGRIKDPSSVATLVQYVSYERTEVIPSERRSRLDDLHLRQERRTERPLHERPTEDSTALGAVPASVLDALVTITGQNFGYDPRAWLTWYRNQVAAGARSGNSRTGQDPALVQVGWQRQAHSSGFRTPAGVQTSMKYVLAVLVGIFFVVMVVAAILSPWLAVNWVLGPLDRAAKNRRYPIQFTLADFLCLFVQIQTLARVAGHALPDDGGQVGLHRHRDRSRGPDAPRLVDRRTTLSRAGIHNTLGRALTLTIGIPFGYAGSLAIPAIGLTTLAMLFEPVSPWRHRPDYPMAALLFLAEAAIILAVVGLGFLTRRILASAGEPRQSVTTE